MFEVSVRQHFDAAHFLRGYGGKCEALHGHRFEAVISLSSRDLNPIGLVFDFVELKRQLNEVLAALDHHLLNEVPPFDQVNPSSENLAHYIYHQLKERLGTRPFSLSRVQVFESPEAWATYSPG